jgi:hypothetical protein
MRDKKSWAWILLFGSLWGISEVMGGEILAKNSVPHYSVILAVWALFILGVGRGIINKPGTSTVIGGIATLFKLVNAAPFICHLLGIFTLGLAFDIFASLLLKKDQKVSLRTFICGAVSAFSGFALFALLITYIIRYDIWVSGGIAKVADHIFVSGGLASLVGLLVVPAGFLVGINSSALAEKRPRLTYAGTLAAAVIIWIAGRFSG